MEVEVIKTELRKNNVYDLFEYLIYHGVELTNRGTVYIIGREPAERDGCAQFIQSIRPWKKQLLELMSKEPWRWALLKMDMTHYMAWYMHCQLLQNTYRDPKVYHLKAFEKLNKKLPLSSRKDYIAPILPPQEESKDE